MSGISGRLTSASTALPSADEVHGQLDRILESAPLSGSPRRRDLLRYLVEETLAGRSNQIKGYSVALAVFDRDDTFDPSSDPVVRLEAGRLRRSLDTYYVNAGRDDPVRIAIPKGAYVADFSWQTEDTPPTSAVGATVSVQIPMADDETNLTPRQPPKTAEPPKARNIPKPSRQIVVLVMIALLLAAGLSWFGFRSTDPNTVQAHGSAIIVLPFGKLDGSDDTNLFANAITQDLINDLMHFPDFRLYSAQSSFAQDPATDPVALGSDLGVAYVLRGNVQSATGRIRLDAQLVNTSSGEVVWSNSYNRLRSPDDLFGLRSDLSSEVATALGETYGIVNTYAISRLSDTGSPSFASYSCVLRGYEYRRAFQTELFRPALICLQKAVVEDPGYADAWAMLAWLQLDAARQDIVPAAEHPARTRAAFEAASRALELDPANQRGLAALSAITFDTGDFDRSEQLQRRAVELNPNDPETLAQLGWRLSVRGNWEEGIPLLTKAIDRSVNPPGWYYHLISVHEYLEGNYAEALAAAERSAKCGSAIGLSLAAISHAKLGNAEASRDNLAAMAEAWPLLASDPASGYRNFHATDQIVEALVAGLQEAGWRAP